MIITQTPLRISIAGGGSDLRSYYSRREGCVVSSAIDKYVFVIVKQRFDRKIYVNYSKREIVDDVGEIRHDLVRECMRMAGIPDGIEITTLADIPSEGTGLGSSSSLTVGLLNALYAYKGELHSQEDLAHRACEIEIERVGKPIGKQDQYIAAYGGLRMFRFRRDGGVSVEEVSLDAVEKRRLSSRLLLFYSNQTRSADTILQEQNRKTHRMMEPLNEMVKLAEDTYAALLQRRYDEVGLILHLGWKLKKSLVESISNGTIDEMVERAVQAGAIGGKICGAGGGGFLLLYCELQHQEEVRKALSGYRELPFSLARDGTKVIFNIRS